MVPAISSHRRRARQLSAANTDRSLLHPNLVQQPGKAAVELLPARCRQTGSSPPAPVPQLAGQTRGKLPRAPAKLARFDFPDFSREESLPAKWGFSPSQESEGETRQVLAASRSAGE